MIGQATTYWNAHRDLCCSVAIYHHTSRAWSAPLQLPTMTSGLCITWKVNYVLQEQINDTTWDESSRRAF